MLMCRFHLLQYCCNLSIQICSPALVYKINAKFKHFSKDDQFLFLMKTEELSKEVAKYCCESSEKRNVLLVA